VTVQTSTTVQLNHRTRQDSHRPLKTRSNPYQPLTHLRLVMTSHKLTRIEHYHKGRLKHLLWLYLGVIPLGWWWGFKKPAVAVDYVNVSTGTQVVLGTLFVVCLLVSLNIIIFNVVTVAKADEPNLTLLPLILAPMLVAYSVFGLGCVAYATKTTTVSTVVNTLEDKYAVNITTFQLGTRHSMWVVDGKKAYCDSRNVVGNPDPVFWCSYQ